MELRQKSGNVIKIKLVSVKVEREYPPLLDTLVHYIVVLTVRILNFWRVRVAYDFQRPWDLIFGIFPSLVIYANSNSGISA
jgi:hypothetical protein